jgi:hypothetical protein
MRLVELDGCGLGGVVRAEVEDGCSIACVGRTSTTRVVEVMVVIMGRRRAAIGLASESRIGIGLCRWVQ